MPPSDVGMPGNYPSPSPTGSSWGVTVTVGVAEVVGATVVGVIEVVGITSGRGDATPSTIGRIWATAPSTSTTSTTGTGSPAVDASKSFQLVPTTPPEAAITATTHTTPNTASRVNSASPSQASTRLTRPGARPPSPFLCFATPTPLLPPATHVSIPVQTNNPFPGNLAIHRTRPRPPLVVGALINDNSDIPPQAPDQEQDIPPQLHGSGKDMSEKLSEAVEGDLEKFDSVDSSQTIDRAAVIGRDGRWAAGW